jgi:hypothetical protein
MTVAKQQCVTGHSGGPAVRRRLLVVRCPEGLTQVTAGHMHPVAN